MVNQEEQVLKRPSLDPLQDKYRCRCGDCNRRCALRWLHLHPRAGCSLPGGRAVEDVVGGAMVPPVLNFSGVVRSRRAVVVGAGVVVWGRQRSWLRLGATPGGSVSDAP